MLYIGIDVGKTGAIAFIRGNRVVNVIDCPLLGKEYDTRAMVSILKQDTPELVVIEKVHAFPEQGVVSMFNFGMGLGLWVGICSGLGLKYELVAPQTWKKLLLKDMTKDKCASVIKVKQLFPEAERFLQRKKDHNRADAILLAVYARSQVMGLGGKLCGVSILTQ